MKHVHALALLLVAAPLASRATTITYDLALPAASGATFTGTITTDGASGTLQTADILSWNIELRNGAQSLNLTPSDSAEQIIGTSNVSATSTALHFNFGGAISSEFLIQDPDVGSGSQNLFCIQTTGCTGVGQNNYQMVIGGTVVSSPGFGTNITFATAPAVPLPAAVWLLLSGLGGLGVLLRTRAA